MVCLRLIPRLLRQARAALTRACLMSVRRHGWACSLPVKRAALAGVSAYMRLAIVSRSSLLTIAILGLTACGDYSICLPNGYRLVTASGGFVVTDEPLGPGTSVEIVVSSDVAKYDVVGELVVGHVTTHEGMAPIEKRQSKPGYFIVNTGTGWVVTGLTRAHWRAKLASRGVTEAPWLTQPSSLDAIRLDKVFFGCH